MKRARNKLSSFLRVELIFVFGSVTLYIQMNGRSVSHLSSDHNVKLIITTAVGLMSIIKKIKPAWKILKSSKTSAARVTLAALIIDHCPVFVSLQCLACGQTLMKIK